jgi:glycosyltransferase involved in cell wall biosynthesis
VLTICVPSRNRQIYLKEAIRSLLTSTRADVEFVIADNSDDPAIMNAFMQPLMGDPRIVYLPSEPQTLSMMDNWERTLRAATGRFVSIIGDDDFIDPELAGFLINLEQKVSPDAVCWSGASYIWPDERPRTHPVYLSMKTTVTQFDKKHLVRKAFLWEDCRHVPMSGFSIYHGAFSRRLLDKLFQLGNGRYFEFPVVDYEMAFKAILFGDTFIHIARPFSILGACPASNSIAIGNVESERKSQEQFNRELGRDMNDDAWKADLPFATWHGISACIYIIQYWMTKKYGMRLEGFEQNLVRAFAANCGIFRDRESFDLVSDRYRQAIATWKDGRYLADFEPEFKPRLPAPPGPAFSGLRADDILVFPDSTGGVRTPGELFHMFECLLARPDEIAIDLASAASANPVLMAEEAA